MGFLSIFKKKKQNTEPQPQQYSHAGKMIIQEFSENNFLGKAAESGSKAKAAVKAEKYDEAWRLYHEQKSYYMQNANRLGSSRKQILALDSNVHEELANILRLEGKHNDALANIVYWVLAGKDRPIKRHKQKFQSYFNRCKLKNTTLADAEKAVDSEKRLPEFTTAKSLVSKWVDAG